MTIAPDRKTTRRSMLRAFAFVTCIAGMGIPQAASAGGAPHAEQVQSVFWGKSFLVRSGPGAWEERNASGATLAFTFIEVYGNADEIILNDASRDVDLRIDLRRMAIDYADAQHPTYRELYALEGYIDTAGRQHFIPGR